MKRLLLLLLPLLSCFAAEIWAQSPLNALSKLTARERPSAGDVSRLPAAPVYYQAFITVDDEQDVASLRRQGVIINGVFDGFVTAQVPVEVLRSQAMTGRQVALAHAMQLHNDSARHLTAVDPVHLGDGMITGLTGKGVIVGVIDTGFDFNHINLCDEEGRSRVRAVYMPVDTTGLSPVVKGDTLPGSCYESPELISQLTTDYTGSSHGTHTTGTAAGGYRSNGWHGVAPEADIVACGMPSDEFTDVNIANGIKYIFDYADRAGKPCVINMSLGDNFGPNDGTSFLCRVFESETRPGRICVLSAGNDGDAPVCLHQTLSSENDTLLTLLKKPLNGAQYNGYVSMWSDRDQVHRTRIVAINSVTHETEYASPWVGHLPEDSILTFSSDDDASFAKFFTGTIRAANAMEPQFKDGAAMPPRYHSVWDVDAKTASDNCLLGVQYVCNGYTSLVGWATKSIYFCTYGVEGAVEGSSFGSISDLATTDSVISVGAYCSRADYVSKSGKTIHIGGCYPYDIAYFSSYGPDERGISRPDVCAPGMALISSANRYNNVANRDRWPAPETVEGIEYPYYSNQGTSMSAPMVTGTIALMLQVDPSLSAWTVRNVFRNSSINDEYVSGGESAQWGFGKLKTQAAVNHVINNTLMRGDVNRDRSVNVSDLMAVISILLGDGNCHDASQLLRADVNRDGIITISDMNCIIDIILK